MTSSVIASPLAERLLVEIVCEREEAAGHPQESGPADVEALQAGGSLAQRIRWRALHLPGADAALSDIGRVLVMGRGLCVALAILAAIAGFLAAGAALGDGESLSIPMILLALVGVNLFTLLVWMATQVSGVRPPGWLVSLWSAQTRRVAGLSPDGASQGAGLNAMRVLTHGPGARWRIGAVLHGAWLTYTVAGLLTLALLLVVRRYELSWQTTLLSAEGLHELASVFSAAPRLLGASGPEALAVNGELSAADHRGWAQWILLAVLMYGVVPRGIALVVCAVMTARTQPRWERELARPGYARLRDRLMPDRRERVVVDAPPPVAGREPTRINRTLALPEKGLHGVSLEWPDAAREPLPARWTWFGHADDAHSRNAALSRLRAGPVAGLVVVVRATATPDRGLQRFVADLAAAARAPTWIALGEMALLDSRGTDIRRPRIADWQRLAANANAVGGLLEWDAHGGDVRTMRIETAAA